MVLHAKPLIEFVIFYKNSKELSNVCKTLAKSIGEACERRFYTNNENLNSNDNKLLLVTTAVDPRYRLSAFLSYLKNNAKEQLKLNVKKYICFEAHQVCNSSILPPEIPKPQHSVNFDPKSFQLAIVCLK